MPKTSATGRIRIIKIPDGEAPLEIRQSWVRCGILNCHPYLGYSEEGPERGVLTDTVTKHSRCGVSVPQENALEILARHDPEAARWWRDNGFPQKTPYDCFFFAEDEIEIISGVTRQTLIEVRDEDLGDPYR